MEDNQLIEEIKAQYNRDYLRMVNEQGVKSGKNNWELVFRTFTIQKLAEFELRLKKLELPTTAAATVTAKEDGKDDHVLRSTG